ncbi:response regulator [Azospirillum sp. SYSU D00513]|uniref:response regulator n=1 Tax=Azospirillum sp. SYSU D00513 TaxID=2812561 RepID=UPI001A97D0C4
MKAIVVEDDAVVSLYIKMVLKDLGHDVCAVAATVPKAISDIECHKPDFVTCDVSLAGKGSGAEVARAAYERWGIKTLFISANIDSALRKETEDLGPLGYVSKPFVTGTLASALAFAALN